MTGPGIESGTLQLQAGALELYYWAIQADINSPWYSPNCNISPSLNDLCPRRLPIILSFDGLSPVISRGWFWHQCNRKRVMCFINTLETHGWTGIKPGTPATPVPYYIAIHSSKQISTVHLAPTTTVH